MKITAVRTHLLEHRLDTPFESASMRFDRRAHILVEIECDDGTVGWGECLGPARPNAAVVQAYSGWLIGQDPRQTEKIWAVLYNALRDQGQRGLSLTALSGIDIALWDIKGKHYGASVSMLLGGRWRESVRAYATGSFKRDGVDRVSDNAAEMAERRADGFHACKIKIGFGIEEDLRVIAAVREAIGPDMRLMIDANHGYTVTEAITLGNRAADYGIDWFEEPVVPEQLDAYARVRAGQPIPVAGGETWHGRYGMWQALSAGAVDILQPDLCGCGGFRNAEDCHARNTPRRAHCTACLGHRCADCRRPAIHGGDDARSGAGQPHRADHGIRPHAQSLPPGRAETADRGGERRCRHSQWPRPRHRDQSRCAYRIQDA